MPDDSNAQATEAWNTVLFEKFSRFRDVSIAGFGLHGDEMLRRHPPAEGTRVLDVGCGFGDMTLQLAQLVGARGEAVGVDVAQNFVAVSEDLAREAGVENARFIARDVQTAPLEGPYTRMYSRFGTSFFASPVAALRNMYRALAPGGELFMVTWRKREDNDWLYAAERRVRDLGIVENPESDAPTCGPGPFSMAGADLVSDQLRAAGFDAITFERYDSDICIGRSLQEAIDFAIAIGPAGEILRLAGAEGERRKPEVLAALREVLTGFTGERGVYAPSSSWIIGARRPA